MSDQVIALVDCNNFYASCERLFRPKLSNKPIIVLSNNDGCVVARSNEAKALSIPMGAPYFKVKDIVKAHQIAVFSSNYALYGDLSNRVMTLLQQYSPRSEIYSIDEAFLDFSGFSRWNLNEYAREIQRKVCKWTGIPLSIGIAQTKTLAKVANMLAKKDPLAKGVIDLTKRSDLKNLLGSIPVQKIWGIGKQTTKKLNQIGIWTAQDLATADIRQVRKRASVVVARTALELSGTPCLPLETERPVRKQILCSRSFGHKIESLHDMNKAITHFTSRTAEKLRKERLQAGKVTVFFRTSPFRKDLPNYANALSTKLTATDSTMSLLHSALQLLKRIYLPGYKYQQAGVMLSQLSNKHHRQQLLFADDSLIKKQASLMTTLDSVNRSMGRGTMLLASEEFEGKWKMNQKRKTPNYTTQWGEFALVF